MEIWTILAPGPSLRRLTLDRFNPPGPVLALNNAALSPLPKDFWMMQDPCHRWEHVWSRMDQGLRRYGPVIWCKGGQAPKWREKGFRAWPHPDSEADFRSRFRVPDIKFTWTSLTITSAICRAIGEGAGRLEIWGCDMAGSEYAFGKDNRSRPPTSWGARWKDEVGTFNRAKDAWEAEGIPITLRFPEP